MYSKFLTQKCASICILQKENILALFQMLVCLLSLLPRLSDDTLHLN